MELRSDKGDTTMEEVVDTDLEFVEKGGSGALQTQTSGESVAVEPSAADEVSEADASKV